MKNVLILLGLFLGTTALAAGGPLRDQFGNHYDPENLSPKVTVLDFAASWCQPCWRALPHLQAYAKAHPEVQVLVVSEDDQRAGRDTLVKKLGLKIPVVWDEDHQLAKKMNPPGMPTTYVLDADGKVVHFQVGEELV